LACRSNFPSASCPRFLDRLHLGDVALGRAVFADWKQRDAAAGISVLIFALLP
jgi:hypothetical protein